MSNIRTKTPIICATGRITTKITESDPVSSFGSDLWGPDPTREPPEKFSNII